MIAWRRRANTVLPTIAVTSPRRITAVIAVTIRPRNIVAVIIRPPEKTTCRSRGASRKAHSRVAPPGSPPYLNRKREAPQSINPALLERNLQAGGSVGGPAQENVARKIAVFAPASYSTSIQASCVVRTSK